MVFMINGYVFVIETIQFSRRVLILGINALKTLKNAQYIVFLMIYKKYICHEKWPQNG